MSGKSLIAVIAATLLVGGSGCVSDSGRSGLFGFAGNQPSDSKQLSPEFREAQKTFRRNTPKAILAWARYQEDVGEYAEALRRYRELSIAYPENIEAKLGLARVENATGRFQQAEEILRQLATDYPDNTQIHLELGHLYVQREDWNAATAAFEQACRQSPHDQVCRYELGIALARNGVFDAALPHLTFAVGQSAAHYNIGYILHEEGRKAEAAEWLTAALSMHPDQKTADQARRLLAHMPEVPGRKNTVAESDFEDVPGAIEPEEERVDSGVRQASWTAPPATQSRLKTIRENQPQASAVRNSMNSGQSEVTTPQRPLMQSQNSPPALPTADTPSTLQPPQWRPANPISR